MTREETSYLDDGYAKYYRDGKIWRNERLDTLGRKVKGKWLQTKKANTGKYCQVSVNGVSKGVHRFMLEAFNPRDDMHTLQVNHIDGNPMNNHIDNLEWVSGSENQKHAIRTKLREQVSGRGSSTLRGVHADKNRKFQVNVQMNGKNQYYGTFETEMEAGIFYDMIIDSHNLPYRKNFMLIDDFESRTCENCKYSKPSTFKNKLDTLECKHEWTERLLFVSKDFGCNRFEAKND